MKKKIIIISVVILLIILFFPFTNVDHNTEGEFQYCRYRLAVYKFWYIESEGEGYDESDSDTFIGNIILEEKIGGPLEYFGLKEIKKDSIN